ncbi:MAG TPA: S-layer homology domain-containing protein [Vicinamibacteria bacterium]|nr:S-layer homology domain-containing protein [Vicinamibacteria bacterium]
MRLDSRSLLPWVVLLVAPAAWAQVPAGGEFLVNTYTAGTQSFPAVAAGPTGAFMVVWFDFGVAPTVVRARRFDREGAPQGGDFQVNAATTAEARDSVVAADARGRYAILWNNVVLPAATPLGVFGRVFDRQGVPQGGEFRLSASTNAVGPSVAVRPGGFVGTWTGYGSEILARRFDARGVVQGAEIAVNTFTTGIQYGPAVAATPTGEFMVVWAHGLGAPSGIFGRRFDASGNPLGAQFQVNTSAGGGQNRPQITSDANGQFVAVWADPPILAARRFSAAGDPLGGEFVVNTFANGYLYDFAVEASRAGGFTVVWEADDLDGDDAGVFGRRFTAAGLPRGAAFRINTYTTDFQRVPDIADDGHGNLTATWMSTQLSATTYDLYGQRYGGLVPESLSIEDGGNQVLEVPDDFGLRTSWRNVSGAAVAFGGTRLPVTVPSGLFLTLSNTTSYGTVLGGAVSQCSPCFAGALMGVRPPGHVDLVVTELIIPDGQGQAQPWRVHVGRSFTDVPSTSAYYRFVETLMHRGVTGGCGNDNYCPGAYVTRAQLAAFLLAAKEGAGYAPQDCAAPVFADVPAASPFCRWIEELARRGVVAGCGGGNYCPDFAVNREQMAVFLLRTLDPALTPPACVVPVFADVPAASPFCRWIEELARRGISTGCGGGNFCPSGPVMREQMAVFLSLTFGLTLYGP